MLLNRIQLVGYKLGVGLRVCVAACPWPWHWTSLCSIKHFFYLAHLSYYISFHSYSIYHTHSVFLLPSLRSIKRGGCPCGGTAKTSRALVFFRVDVEWNVNPCNLCCRKLTWSLKWGLFRKKTGQLSSVFCSRWNCIYNCNAHRLAGTIITTSGTEIWSMTHFKSKFHSESTLNTCWPCECVRVQ